MVLLQGFDWLLGIILVGGQILRFAQDDMGSAQDDMGSAQDDMGAFRMVWGLPGMTVVCAFGLDDGGLCVCDVRK